MFESMVHFKFVHLRVNNILQQWVQFWWKYFDMLPNDWKAKKTVLQTIMEAHADMLIKFICLLPVLAAPMVSKKCFLWSETFFNKMVVVGPGMLQWCVNCFGNAFTCWQLIAKLEMLWTNQYKI